MFIQLYSYRFAWEILTHPKFNMIFDELITICEQCPLPTYAGKSARQPNKDVVQQVMNTYFKLRFEDFGWESEPLATPNEHEDELRADFRKTFLLQDGQQVTIQIEVEFGNAASSYRNYFKFQLSFSYDLTDICVLIVPCSHLANRIDSGVASFEKAKREISQAKLSTTVPILVIGLFDFCNDTPVPEWDLRDDVANVDIAKNSNKNYEIDHIALVRSYIESIE